MSDASRLATLTPHIHRALAQVFGPAVAPTAFDKLPGQASNRVYFRVPLRGGASVPEAVILVLLPDDPFASEEAAGTRTAGELPFCAMLHYLDGRGLPVPALLWDGAGEGFLLQEDLGDTTMLKALTPGGEDVTAALYRRALALLVQWQRATRADSAPESRCLGHERRFDYDLLRWELDHFKEWLLLDWARASLTPAQDRLLETSFDHIARKLAQSTYLLAHRDFQSTNLMVGEDGEFTLIDFQDALMAPPVYDLVALLRDSYVALPPSLLDTLCREYYAQARELLPFASAAEFEAAFHLQTLQRKLKDAGRFVFIDRVKHNPGYLQWIEPTLGYVAHALAHLPEYASLRDVLVKAGPFPDAPAPPRREEGTSPPSA